MFSKSVTPISELVKGDPEKALREPTLAFIACLFNVYQIFEFSQRLAQASSVPSTDPWYGYIYMIQMSTMAGLVVWYIAFSILLLIGAAVSYFINRRVGGALLLVFGIIGLIVAFVGLSYSFIGGFNIISLFINFLSPIFALLAGIWGLRAKGDAQPDAVYEII